MIIFKGFSVSLKLGLLALHTVQQKPPREEIIQRFQLGWIREWKTAYIIRQAFFFLRTLDSSSGSNCKDFCPARLVAGRRSTNLSVIAVIIVIIICLYQCRRSHFWSWFLMRGLNRGCLRSAHTNLRTCLGNKSLCSVELPSFTSRSSRDNQPAFALCDCPRNWKCF